MTHAAKLIVEARRAVPQHSRRRARDDFSKFVLQRIEVKLHWRLGRDMEHKPEVAWEPLGKSIFDLAGNGVVGGHALFAFGDADNDGFTFSRRECSKAKFRCLD